MSSSTKEDKKRNFVVAGSDFGDTGGNYHGKNHAVAAKKAASIIAKKRIGKDDKELTFRLLIRETTNGSPKKTNSYKAEVKKFKTPKELPFKDKDGNPVFAYHEVKVSACTTA